jgi:hypothetical protein
MPQREDVRRLELLGDTADSVGATQPNYLSVIFGAKTLRDSRRSEDPHNGLTASPVALPEG